MDEITQGWNSLSLMDREEDNMPLSKKGPKEEFSLVARFLTSRALNINAVARTFSPLWRSQNGFQIRNLGDHKLLFIFDNKPDVERILQNEPWSFDKHLMVLQCYNKDTPVDDLTFNRTSFNLGIGTRHTSEIHESKGSGRDLQHHWYCHQEA